jgi:hypothetical protein
MPFWAFIQAQSSIGIDQTNRNFEKIFEKTWAVPFPFAELPTSDGKKRIQLEAVAFLVNSTSISNQRQRKKIGELLYSILLNEKKFSKNLLLFVKFCRLRRMKNSRSKNFYLVNG